MVADLKARQAELTRLHDRLASELLHEAVPLMIRNRSYDAHRSDVLEILERLGSISAELTSVEASLKLEAKEALLRHRATVVERHAQQLQRQVETRETQRDRHRREVRSVRYDFETGHR
jgi:hypothetical protein